MISSVRFEVLPLGADVNGGNINQYLDETRPSLSDEYLEVVKKKTKQNVIEILVDELKGDSTVKQR